MTVKHLVELDTNDIVDILSSASIGSNYWLASIGAEQVDYKRAKDMASREATIEEIWADILFYGKYLIAHYYDQDGDEETCTDEITLDKLKKGVNLVLDNKQWNGEETTFDSVVADAIIQYALFDEIVYG